MVDTLFQKCHDTPDLKGHMAVVSTERTLRELAKLLLLLLVSCRHLILVTKVVGAHALQQSPVNLLKIQSCSIPHRPKQPGSLIRFRNLRWPAAFT